MKIFIDTKSTKDGNAIRGVGLYTNVLMQSLAKYAPEVTLVDANTDADIVHYPYFDLFFLTLPIRKKKPTIVTVHDTIPLLYPKAYQPGIRGAVKLLLQKQSLKGAKQILTVSNQSKNDIAQYLGVDQARISVVYPSISEDFSAPDDAKKKLVQEKYHLPESYLLYIGDVNYNKNLERLIEAFASVAIPGKQLVIGGQGLTKDIPEANIVKQKIKEYNLTLTVHSIGYIAPEDLSAVIGSALAYIQPSLYEGFGLPILEAFACGTPVLSSNASSLPEVYGDAALAFNPEQIGAIRQAMVTLWFDSALRDALRQKGFERLKNFSQEKFAGQTALVYKQVFDAAYGKV